MELVLLVPESAEWNYMWKWLEDHPLNKDIPLPSFALNEGEGWQYVGSLKENERVIHQLRHRNHPVTKKVTELLLTASKDFTNDQIQKQFKL